MTSITRWRKNPCDFVFENFGVDPDEWQRDALNAFVRNDHRTLRISLQACAGPGKSAVLAWCGWLFLSCYGEPGEHPKGAAVSITGQNLKDNLWAELSKWQQKSKFLSHFFEWNSEKIYAKDHPETWFLSARSWPKKANAEEIGRTLSGIHSKFVLYLIDESGDIPPAIAKAAEQGLGGCEFGRILQAGNPTSTTGMLYEAAVRQPDKWLIIKITGDPQDPKRSPRINIEWANDQIARYGRDDPWVMSFILGQFPTDSINTLLSIDDIDKAMRRPISEDAYKWSQKRIGVDVARFGLDSTVLFPRQGLRAFKFVAMRGADTAQIAARVASAKNKWGSELEFIDDTGGFGAGVIDNLIAAGHAPMGINFSGKPGDPKYFNIRAQMWMEMADWIKRGGVLPDDNILRKELAAPTYSFRNGKFIIEPKERIKERLGFSPDHADALALTFAIPDQPKFDSPYAVLDRVKNQQVLHDYDPLD